MTAAMLAAHDHRPAEHLFLGSDGFPVIPLSIVAVVVAYVAGNRLTPVPAAGPAGADDDGGHRAPGLPPPRAGETPVDASSRPGPRADRPS